MSVIFRSLKKVRSQAGPGNEPEPQGLRHSRSVYSLRRLMLSPLALILLAGAVVVAVMAVYFAAGFLLDRTPPPRSARLAARLETPAAEEPEPEVRPGDLPPAPGQVDVEEKQPRFEPPAAPLEAAPETAPSSRFITPQENSGSQAESLGSELRPQPVETAEMKFDQASGQAAYPHQSDPGPTGDAPAPEAAVKSDTAPVRATAVNNSPAAKTARAADQPAGSGKPRAGAKPKAAPDQPSGQASTADLVERALEAINRGDDAQTAELAARLTEIKGPGHPFVLKLQAYRLLKAGDLDGASRRLNKILAQSPDDLEAGLNMAVIEARSGRVQAARRRLGRLAEIYPADERPAAMKARLSGP